MAPKALRRRHSDVHTTVVPSNLMYLAIVMVSDRLKRCKMTEIAPGLRRRRL